MSDLVDLFLAGHLDLLSFELSLLSELCLKIGEQSVRWDFDLCDFNRFKPDSPAFELILQVILHVILEMVSVLQNFLERRVSDEVSKHWFAHSFDIGVGITSLHILVASERSIFFSVDTPEGKTADFNTLHLFGHIVGRELNSFNFWCEFHITVSYWN